jgi:two-component system OmpR family sensor kinase
MMAESRRGLLVGLSGIAAVFVLESLFTSFWTSRSETEARRLHEDSLASIELVAKIGRDIDQERILVDDHIFERPNVAMAQIEVQIQRYVRDLQAAREAYRPLIDLPNELSTWKRAEAEIARFDVAMASALTLSRSNRDEEAHAAMASVLREYDDLDRLLADLIRLNRKGASDALAHIKDLERSAEKVVVGVRIAGLVLLVLLGRWTLRRIALYEAQRARMLAALEDRNRELDAFSGRVAHDLRSPLAALALTTEHLYRVAPVEQASAIERLRRVIKRIEVMIEDLLALSRIERSPENESCDPSRVATTIGEDFVERFGEEATLRRDVAPAHVACGEGLLRQAVWNLIDNGVKYRRHEVRPELVLSGRLTSEGYELRVSDNGMGMSPEDASHAFEPFYRAERALAMNGTGLGLSIVKRIVEARRGTVSVESRPEQGTTFFVRLSLAKDAWKDSRRVQASR